MEVSVLQLLSSDSLLQSSELLPSRSKSISASNSSLTSLTGIHCSESSILAWLNFNYCIPTVTCYLDEKYWNTSESSVHKSSVNKTTGIHPLMTIILSVLRKVSTFPSPWNIITATVGITLNIMVISPCSRTKKNQSSCFVNIQIIRLFNDASYEQKRCNFFCLHISITTHSFHYWKAKNNSIYNLYKWQSRLHLRDVK